MDLLQETVKLLRFHKIKPKKRLGQNFVINSELLKRMVSCASINEKDIVLEVGAGLGFLTQILAKKCMRVIAVEVDPNLMKILRKKTHNLLNVELIKGDILNLSVPQFNKVVSFPPYSISSSLLLWLLKRKYDCIVLTFQKEFTEKLVSAVGSKNYGRLTVVTHYIAKVDFLNHVPRNMFYPSPDVDSVIVRFKPREPPFFVENKEFFFELLRILFTQRNRKVRNASISILRKKGGNKGNTMKLADSLPFSNKRVRELTPQDFAILSNEISTRER